MTEDTATPVPCLTNNNPKDRPRRSDTLGKLGLALAKAQGEMLNAEKDVRGNYGKYATLAATWDAIRGPLSKNEIAVYQRPLPIDGKLIMCTMLIHSSGEFIDDGELELIYDKSGGRLSPMQAMGSAVTYARRYTLQAATGVAPADDDDGEGAGKPPTQNQPQTKIGAPARPAAPPPASKPAPANNAPVTPEIEEQILNYAIDRQVNEGELAHLVIDGYGVQRGKKPPMWIALEVLELLKNPETTSGTVMAQSVRVKNRREAAALAKSSGT